MAAPTRETTLRIVALHGNGGGGFRFARIEPHLPADVAFHAITLPGFADAPRNPALQTLRDYADYLHQIAADMGQPDQILLLGTGIGGSIVLEYIQHYPVQGVILHAPVGAKLDERRFPALMKVPGMTRLGQWMFASPLFRPLFKRLLFVDHTNVPPAYLTRFFEEYGQNSVFGQMFEIITAEWFRTLKPREVPAALLWGAEERVLDASHVEVFQQLLPGAIVRIVPDWDHFPMIEQPAAYAAEVVALARQVQAQASE